MANIANQDLNFYALRKMTSQMNVDQLKIPA